AAAGRRLAARAAVATGEVAVTIGVQGQGMVAGDLVNTAARLQTVAPPNGVLVDTTTRRVVGDAVSFERAGRVDLRGKAEAHEAWRATDVPAPGGRGRAAGHGGTFVGRSRELAELVELHRRTVASRRSRLVSVIGIAGIGKSRLVWEFERHLDLLPEPLALHIGRVPAYGEGITFAPLAEMVRRRARIAEGTDSEVARRQLAATLEELIPDEAERQWVEPRLATLLEPGEHASFERDELFAAWRRFFEGVAAWAPALLIFEDLQWADGALLDFIDHLALWSRDHPILVVTLARPEFLDRRPNWGTGLPSFTSIQLEPLDDVAMAELLVGLAPGLAPEDVSRIAATSGGVPLYGVEVVRMLLDRGLAHLEEGTLMLLEPLDGVRIPETLQSLVSARIDAIPRQERGLLLSASVLGRRFHPDALAAISRLRPDEARQRIIALSRRELLAVDDDLRSPGRGQLSFVQDVVREVAYRTLSRRERRTLHVAAADHLDSLRDDELVEAVAEHLVDAHQAAPEHPEAAQVAARAVDALRRAAARAMTLHVPERALTHLRRALDLVDDDGTRAELWGEASAAARAVPDFETAEKLLRRLIAWHDESGAPEAAARARAGLASLLLATERHASAIGDLEAALAGIADLPADTASVELIGQLARARVLVGQDRQGLEWADRALALARTSGLDAIAVDALVTRGTARMRLGEETSGSADLREAIREADRLGLVGAGLRARNNLAWLVVLDDPHMTLETARVGFEVATRMGVGDMALQLASIVVAVAIDTGEWMAAQSMLDEMRERPQAPAHRIQFVATDAMLRAMQGDITAAALLEALEPVDPDTDAQIVAAIDEASAWIAFAQGRFDDARRCAEAAASGSLGAE
ncbi:MAG: AAA family ATPase, partial [Chloroflexi bacterium]|nr:AAA family ATPase [Chloroflexota bacterium]